MQASNLRAACYAIGEAPADELETKRIAGNVVPAIATTTAIVAGLVALHETCYRVRRRPSAVAPES